MADLCFLVQHYELAYSCYHTAKKDFLSDQAMLYAAGALVGAHVKTSPYMPHQRDQPSKTSLLLCAINLLLGGAERLMLLHPWDIRVALTPTPNTVGLGLGLNKPLESSSCGWG